jgi:hypothetical protein
LLGPGDLLRLDVGAKHGVAKEQNFVVRRRFLGDDEYGTKKAPLLGEQTAGLVQIIEVDDKSSVAIVVYACGEILAGDTVEPFIPSPAFFAIADGKPRSDEPARITFGEYDSTIAGAGQMMVIDRGTLRGVQRGQRVTLFRASAIDKQLPVTIGDGVVIAVRADSATIRIERTTDAVWVGDLVALHR